jgi:hypothetical protein
MALRMDMVHRAAEKTDPMPELEQLCDEIGPRLTGGIAAQAAERQVLEYMRKIGLQQVHTEGWTLPRGWHRGPATASLVTPFRIPIPIAASVGPDRRRRIVGQCRWYFYTRMMLPNTLIPWLSRRLQTGAAKH